MSVITDKCTQVVASGAGRERPEIELIDIPVLKYARLLNTDLREEFLKSRGREKEEEKAC